MAKVSKKYLEYEDYALVEKGFHPDRSAVSESLFAQANEYLGVRAAFEEGSSLKSLRGTYFNGLYDYALSETPNAYKGIVKRTHYMLNSPDFFRLAIEVDGETLDLATAEISDFVRRLDFLSGELTRRFVVRTASGWLRFTFRRLLSMEESRLALQQVEVESQGDVHLKIDFLLDADVLSWGSVRHYYVDDLSSSEGLERLLTHTINTERQLAYSARINAPSDLSSQLIQTATHIGRRFEFNPESRRCYRFEKVIAVEYQPAGRPIDRGRLDALAQASSYAIELEKNSRHFRQFFDQNDIVISGDPANQQGIRFCLFQLHQTYRGLSPFDNIGAKGLTGEAYSGHTFWDTETYCLPYYLFSEQEAAKNLLLYRYQTLPQAKKRARDLDCEGACYPIATLSGEEACNLWQHASLQLQPSSGVVYGIYHYVNVSQDEDFLRTAGYEMVYEVARFLLSRGQYNADQTKFGFYGVMGPDEFQMMVNHNTYTNYLGRFVFDYFLSLTERYRHDPSFAQLFERLKIEDSFVEEVRRASQKMLILHDEETHLFEQHQGFYDLPHIDVDQIPAEEFPLYSHWTYDRIYRNDMIKQPDVLMFMFLFLSRFSQAELAANYDYYEPRCIHESSLSPSVHSVIAARIGRPAAALRFFEFATRLDLDDYNNNTAEGLHLTSIAAAYINIIYGFAGLTSDGPVIKLSPMLPAGWDSYSFHLVLRGSRLKIEVDAKYTRISNESEQALEIDLYDRSYSLAPSGILEVERC